MSKTLLIGCKFNKNKVKHQGFSRILKKNMQILCQNDKKTTKKRLQLIDRRFFLLKIWLFAQNLVSLQR